MSAITRSDSPTHSDDSTSVEGTPRRGARDEFLRHDEFMARVVQPKLDEAARSGAGRHPSGRMTPYDGGGDSTARFTALGSALPGAAPYDEGVAGAEFASDGYSAVGGAPLPPVYPLRARGGDIESGFLSGSQQQHFNVMMGTYGETHLSQHSIQRIADAVTDGVETRIVGKRYDPGEVPERSRDPSRCCQATLILGGLTIIGGVAYELWRETNEEYGNKTSYYFGYGCLAITGLWSCLSGVKYALRSLGCCRSRCCRSGGSGEGN